MNKPPAFQFYANDWLSSTKIALMTPAEEGAYIRLLCHAWSDPRCSLPNDDAVLARLSRLNEEWFNQSGDKIKGCFRVKGDRLINDRLKIEREKQKQWREKSRLGGINSGKVRKEKELRPKGGSEMVQTKDEPNGNTSVFCLPSSSSKRKNPLIPPAGFEKFWQVYPKKIGKSDAMKAWVKIAPQDGTIEKIMVALEKWKKTDQWRKDDGQFIPHAATWLNKRRFEDEISEAEIPIWEREQ